MTCVLTTMENSLGVQAHSEPSPRGGGWGSAWLVVTNVTCLPSACPHLKQHKTSAFKGHIPAVLYQQ